MGERGPIKTPPHLRALREGEETPPPRTPPPAPASTRARKVDPPAWLSASGKRAFTQILKNLEATWPDVITRMDIPALAILAEHYAITQAAAKAMRADGNEPEVSSTDARHRERKPPTYQMFRESANAYMGLAREYGLTLAARLRLELDAIPVPPGVGELEDDDDAALFG